MTFTVSLTELSIFLIAITFLILVVSAIPVLIQLRQTVKAVQDLSEEGKKVLEDVKGITSKANGHMEDMEEAVKKLKDVTTKATGVAEVILDAVKGPAVTLAGIIAGINFGLKHCKKGGEEDVRE